MRILGSMLFVSIFMMVSCEKDIMEDDSDTQVTLISWWSLWAVTFAFLSLFVVAITLWIIADGYAWWYIWNF